MSSFRNTDQSPSSVPLPIPLYHDSLATHHETLAYQLLSKRQSYRAPQVDHTTLSKFILSHSKFLKMTKYLVQAHTQIRFEASPLQIAISRFFSEVQIQSFETFTVRDYANHDDVQYLHPQDFLDHVPSDFFDSNDDDSSLPSILGDNFDQESDSDLMIITATNQIVSLTRCMASHIHVSIRLHAKKSTRIGYTFDSDEFLTYLDFLSIVTRTPLDFTDNSVDSEQQLRNILSELLNFIEARRVYLPSDFDIHSTSFNEAPLRNFRFMNCSTKSMPFLLSMVSQIRSTQLIDHSKSPIAFSLERIVSRINILEILPSHRTLGPRDYDSYYVSLSFRMKEYYLEQKQSSHAPDLRLQSDLHLLHDLTYTSRLPPDLRIKILENALNPATIDCKLRTDYIACVRREAAIAIPLFWVISYDEALNSFTAHCIILLMLRIPPHDAFSFRHRQKTHQVSEACPHPRIMCPTHIPAELQKVSDRKVSPLGLTKRKMKVTRIDSVIPNVSASVAHI